MKMTVKEISEKIYKMTEEEKDENKLKAYTDAIDYLVTFNDDNFDVGHLFELCGTLAKVWPEFVGAQMAIGMLAAVQTPEELIDAVEAEIDIKGV